MDKTALLFLLEGCIDVANGTSGDFSVITSFNENGRLVYFKRFNDISQTEQINFLQNLYKQYKNKISVFNIESNNMGATFIDLLRSGGCFPDSFQTTAKTKRQLVENFIVAIQKEKLSLPKIDTLISEMQDFRVNFKIDGGVTFSSPSGKHDDIVMSLMIAWSGYQKYHYFNDNVSSNGRQILYTIR